MLKICRYYNIVGTEEKVYFMASYTEISPKIAQTILDLYSLGEITELIPLSHGISNSNYQVNLKEGKPVLLKISNDKDQSQLAAEQKILKTLKDFGFKLSLTPYVTNDMRLVYQYEDLCGVIYPFISGTVLSPSNLVCQEIGEALGSLHLSTHNQDLRQLNLRNYSDVGFDAGQIELYTLTESCPSDFKQAYAEVLKKQMPHYLNTDLPDGIIHGDLYYDNILFENNHINAILDFEQAGIGSFIFDLGVSISGTCLENGKISINLVKEFLQGYEEARVLSIEEKSLIPEAIKIGLFSIALWRIKRFNERNLDPKKKDNYKELLVRATHFHGNHQNFKL